ncbi:hypothetical protein SJI45_18720 [Streptomyces sp. S399]|uniref:hypothetical protein n=1 Tax=Streptomyces sp. S399 TaxID=3096009 RepID=UPI002A7F0B4A|nr:hypothetical protein [Streptomyces sp. S399]WPR52771.1 hypothetical protein SJI45_18720 [Streptomyces sp. S399]
MTVGDVLVCTILGAAVLAIVQLWTAHRRHERTIRDLHAELTAQRIAALTGSGPLPLQDAAEEPPEPAHRKRHLALYIGGGAVAAIASLSGKLRSLLRGHTAAVAASTTVIVGTAAATALYLTSGTGTAARETPEGRAGRPSASAGDTGTGTGTGKPGNNDATGPEDEPVVLPLDAAAPRPINEPPGPSPTPSGTTDPEADTEQAETEPSAPADSAAPTSAPPEDKPSPPALEPTPSPTSPPTATQPPEPAPSPTSSPTTPAPDDGLCIRLPPLLDLCLF